MKCLLVAVVLAAGCSDLAADPGRVKVIAPAGKCWSGAIGDSTKDGCGTRTFKVTGEAIIVATVQKNSPGHWRLRLELRVKGDLKDTSVTTAAYGIAEVTE